MAALKKKRKPKEKQIHRVYCTYFPNGNYYIGYSGKPQRLYEKYYGSSKYVLEYEGELKKETIARIIKGEWQPTREARGIRKSKNTRKARGIRKSKNTRKARLTRKMKKQKLRKPKYSIKKMRQPKKTTKKY